MNKFRDMGGGKKTSTKTIETSKGIVDFTPTFEKNDMVMVKTSALEYSKDLKKLKGLAVAVDYCKVSDLKDMVIETLYLRKDIHEINNPYLVEYFKKV